MEAVLFVGIQASGKSSFFKERFYDTHVRINGDMLKTAHREQLLITACLEAKQRYVIDKINLTRRQRAKYITDAKAAKFRIIGYYLKCAPREAIARNANRTRKARVPVVAILSAYKHLEIPTLDEGFDELLCVTLDAENRFRIEPANEGNLTKRSEMDH